MSEPAKIVDDAKARRYGELVARLWVDFADDPTLVNRVSEVVDELTMGPRPYPEVEVTPGLRADLKVSAEVADEATAKRFLERATYDRINKRRCELIYRKDGLTSNEQAEFELLQTETRRLVHLAFPFRGVWTDKDRDAVDRALGFELFDEVKTIRRELSEAQKQIIELERELLPYRLRAAMKKDVDDLKKIIHGDTK